MTEEPDDHVVCATYTHARRHPLVIGNIGGWTPPFQLSLPQLAVLGALFWIEMKTWPLWAHVLPELVSVVLALCLPAAAAWAVRRARIEGRTLARAAVGLLALLSAPRDGRAGGRPVHPGRPRSLASARTYVAPGEPR
jgi:hypothetical protein